MSTRYTKTLISLVAIVTVVAWVFGVSGAFASGPAPVKEILTSRLGAQTASLSKGDICVVVSEECQLAGEGTGPGGFSYPTGVAVNTDAFSPEYGDVYVTDSGNERVQELSAGGQFIRMFGWDVNETKDGEVSASQAEKDVCTQVEIEALKVVCGAGVEGSAAGQFGRAASIAVDPDSGNVFVQDVGNARIEEYTSEGVFVLMVGRHVNETDGTDVCTQVEVEKGVKCKAGEGRVEAKEPDGFDFENVGNDLAFGGPRDLLYVGEEGRVQEINPSGASEGEISLGAISTEPGSFVTALAVNASGDAFLVYRVNGSTNAVHEVSPSGAVIKNIEVVSREPEVREFTARIEAIALDPSGRLAVSGIESAYEHGEVNEVKRLFGVIYNDETGRLATEFVGGNASGIGFSGDDKLYSVVSPTSLVAKSEEDGLEVLVYEPVAVAEGVNETPVCTQGPDEGSNTEFHCALKSEVNPEGISETEAWFQWGPPNGHETPRQDVSSASHIETTVEGMTPNETLHTRLATVDHNFKQPVTSELVTVMIPPVAPRVVDEPTASFISSSSAVIFDEVNPEHSGTEYYFEYGPCSTLAGCSTVRRTISNESSGYGAIGTTAEVTGLQPNTRYRYRLVAKGAGPEVEGPENTFTTGPAPTVQATTGGPSSVTATGATISGTVNPDGQPATYVFELGVYTGASTQYGIVYSASTSAETAPIGELLPLSGLQPGTTYAYRIAIHSGYGTAQGTTATFTTEGLPAVLVSPALNTLLATPNIAFPTETKESATTTKALTQAEKLSKALTLCRKDRSRAKKGICEKAAHHKYGPTKKTAKKR